LDDIILKVGTMRPTEIQSAALQLPSKILPADAELSCFVLNMFCVFVAAPMYFSGLHRAYFESDAQHELTPVPWICSSSTQAWAISIVEFKFFQHHGVCPGADRQGSLGSSQHDCLGCSCFWGFVRESIKPNSRTSLDGYCVAIPRGAVSLPIQYPVSVYYGLPPRKKHERVIQ